MVDVGVRVLSHLKEELTWAIDKRLWVISTVLVLSDSKNFTITIVAVKLSR